MEEIDMLKTYLAMLVIQKDMLEVDNRTSLIAALGVAIDVWCKEKGEDPIAFANLLNTKIIEVNTKYGEIGSDNNH